MFRNENNCYHVSSRLLLVWCCDKKPEMLACTARLVCQLGTIAGKLWSGILWVFMDTYNDSMILSWEADLDFPFKKEAPNHNEMCCYKLFQSNYSFTNVGAKVRNLPNENQHFYVDYFFTVVGFYLKWWKLWGSLRSPTLYRWWNSLR